MTRVLLTTTSFQDTPGAHHERLAEAGWEVVPLRGPLSEDQLLAHAEGIDALICGDDALTRAVLEAFAPRLRCISKYGVGLDKIDLGAATALGIPVCNTPGVNHVTVAEHVFALLLALAKNLIVEAEHTRAGRWERLIGHELCGKRLGIVGLGRIGKAVAVRARAFGLDVCAHDLYWDTAFAAEHTIERCADLPALLRRCDVVSLHTSLTPETRGLIDASALALMPRGALLINCARGELVETGAVVEALRAGQLGGYGADVLDVEPPPADHPLLHASRCLVTPHIGSRTYESVVRQGSTAVENLARVLRGEAPLSQANTLPG